MKTSANSTVLYAIDVGQLTKASTGLNRVRVHLFGIGRTLDVAIYDMPRQLFNSSS